MRLASFLTCIAGLVGNDDKMFTATVSNKMRVPRRRPWMITTFWVKIARVGLPIAYIVVALAIVWPGFFNVALLD